MPSFVDLSGHRYGRLTVIERAPIGGRVSWKCRCDCGSDYVVITASLRNGHTRSCGCLHAEVASRLAKVTHGMTLSSEFKIWAAMKNRCRNPRYHEYDKYGGRGIKVCDRWRDSFDNFYADMGSRPSTAYSIDRIDNDGNYEPGNCRWATQGQQNNNKSDNLRVMYRGREMSFADAVREAGVVNYKAAAYRFRRSGWTLEAALETPIYGGSL